MHHDKWYPCVCTAILGVLIIVFAWWQVSWGQIALTVLGALVILKGIINKCCCYAISGCCKEEPKETGGGGCYS